MANSQINNSNQKLTKEDIREQIKEKQETILAQKTSQSTAQKDLIKQAENSSFLDIWTNYKENARGESLNITRIKNSEQNISQRQKEIEGLNKELQLRFPEAIEKQDQITNSLSRFNSIVEKLQLIDKLKKANEKGGTTDEFINYGEEIAKELEVLIKDQRTFSDLREARKQISVLISQKAFPLKLEQELANINTALKAFHKLLTTDQTKLLIAQLKDRSLFHSDSIDNFFYNDFLPIASGIAVGVGLSVLTGGALSGVVLATALRTVMLRGGISLLAQGIGGVIGNELAKEALYQTYNSPADYSNRSLLGAYLNQTEIGGEEIDLGKIIGNYSATALLSAAGSGATQLAGKGLGVGLGFFRYRLDKFAAKISQPLSKEIILPFLPKAAKLALPIKPDTKAEIWKNVLEEYLDETKEAVLERTATLVGSQFQENGIKLPGFNIPLVSLPAAILIALGRSGKYKTLNDPLNYLTRKSSLSDFEEVWAKYGQILPSEDIVTLVNKYYHAYKQKNYYTTAPKNNGAKENFNPKLFFETASFLSNNLHQLSANEVTTLANDYFFLNLDHEEFHQKLTAHFLGNFADFSDSQKACIIKTIAGSENQILIKETLLFFESKVTELKPRSNLAIELFRAYQISGREMPENLKIVVASILKSQRSSHADKSRFEQKVGQFFEQLGIIPQNQVRTLGYELDLILNIGDRRIVVECDGDLFHYVDGIPEHGLYAQDRVKDRVLRNNGYEVVRIPLSIWEKCNTETEKIKLFIDQLGYKDNPAKFFSDLAITNVTQILCQSLQADHRLADTTILQNDCRWIIEELKSKAPEQRTLFETHLLVELDALNQCLELLFALSESRNSAETRAKLTTLQKQVVQINSAPIYSDERLLVLLDYLTLVVQSEGTFFSGREISPRHIFIRQDRAVTAALTRGSEGLVIINNQFFADLPKSNDPMTLDFNATSQIFLLEMLNIINPETEEDLALKKKIIDAALISTSDHVRLYAQILRYPDSLPEYQRENQIKKTREYLQVLRNYFYFRKKAVLKITSPQLNFEEDKKDKQQKQTSALKLPTALRMGAIAERYQKRFAEKEDLENIFYTTKIDPQEFESVFGKEYLQQVMREFPTFESMTISDTERPILHRKRLGNKEVDSFCIVVQEILNGENIFNIRLLNCANINTQRNLIEAILFRYSKYILNKGEQTPIVFNKEELQKILKNPEQTIKDALEMINSQYEFRPATIEITDPVGKKITNFLYFSPKLKREKKISESTDPGDPDVGLDNVS